MESLTTLLIGHRGAGKTTLLGEFKKRHPDWQTYDLDEEIAHSTGETPGQIIGRSEGEFRNHERRVLEELVASDGKKLIAVGAGFEGPVPDGAHVIWVRRVTDSHGRVFTARPRLNTNTTPFNEYMQRFAQREQRYRSWAHEVLTLPEGEAGDLSALLLPQSDLKVTGSLTVLPQDFRDWPGFWNKRRTWGLRYWELRDDLLRPDQIERARQDLPKERVINSIRDGSAWQENSDWPLEKGAPDKPAFVLSLHEREKDLESILKTFGTSGDAQVYKLAIEIRDFYELKRGHDWWQADPAHRAFLPRSPNGRWRWYRSLFGPHMPLHYIREGEGSSPDQPFLWQAVLQPQWESHFAAVLGSPVDHSLSPLEHREFFRNIPFVSIEVKEDEFDEALKVLTGMGLKWAAVTAPLKRLAAQACKQLSETAANLRSVNTLYHNGQDWQGHNTDHPALACIRDELPAFKTVWLWGGGGIKSSVQRVWPEAREISARAGVQSAAEAPDLLIWATGRSREFQWPPQGVRPQLVLDLNYGDDSPGLEWAVQNKLPYQSGLRMFKLQAEAQREYWAAQKDL